MRASDMPPRKKAAAAATSVNGKALPPAEETPLVRAAEALEVTPLPTVSMLPAAWKFPLVALISFSIEVLSKTLMAEFMSGDLALMSRKDVHAIHADEMMAWKLLELAIGWFAGFDGTRHQSHRYKLTF